MSDLISRQAAIDAVYKCTDILRSDAKMLKYTGMEREQNEAD